MRNTLILLRFHFSFVLMPVFLFALSQAENPDWRVAVQVFVILHLLVYPSSNGYNCYYDNDTGSIGGLRNPPKAGKSLLWTAMLMDVAALVWAWNIQELFAVLLLGYILASRAYSHPTTRIKKYPVLGFLWVIFFQGAYTFFMCRMCIGGHSDLALIAEIYLAMIFSSLLLGAMYPLTQIYQHEQDRQNGDHTLSMLLGIGGTFIFSGILFILAQVVGVLWFLKTENTAHFLVLQAFLLPVAAYFIFWFVKTVQDTSKADFDHTMRMNVLAALCLNLGFAVLTVL